MKLWLTVTLLLLTGVVNAQEQFRYRARVARSTSSQVTPSLAVSITTPSAQPTFQVPSGIGLVYSGTSNGPLGISSVAYTCQRAAPGDCGSGTATGTATWSVGAGLITLTCTGSPGTSHTITVTVTDSGMNTAVDTLTMLCLTADVVAPQIIITGPTTSPTYSTSVSALTVTGGCTDNVTPSSVTISCATCTPTTPSNTGSASVFRFAFTAQTTGANTITVTCQDAETNSAQDILTSTYTTPDVTPPVVTITSDCGSGAGANCTTTSLPQTLTGTCTDTIGCTLVSFACTNATPATGTASGTSAWSFALTSITPGATASCAVTGRDQATNTHQDTVAITYLSDLIITTTTMPPATQNVAFSAFIQAVGGSGNKTWDNNSGGSSLGAGACTGLSITTHTDNQQGRVSGTPTTTGTCNFTAKITDSQGTPDTDTQALSISVASPGAEGPFTYFDTLSALSTSMEFSACTALNPTGGCSFRSATQLTNINSNSMYTYLCTGATPANCTSDTFVPAQEAAKLVHPQTTVSVAAQNRIDIRNATVGSVADDETTGAYFITWDSWYDPRWLAAAYGGSVDKSYNHKEYQVAFGHNSGTGGSGDGAITFEIGHKYGDTTVLSSTEVASAHIRVYTSCQNVDLDASCQEPEDITLLADLGITPDPYGIDVNGIRTLGQGSAGQNVFHVKSATWTRYWVLCELNLSGSDAAFAAWNATYPLDVPAAFTGHACSVWMADEQTAATRIAFRMPIMRGSGSAGLNVYNHIRKFWFEHNTSTEHDRAQGPLTVTGVAGTVIPANTQVRRNSDSLAFITSGSNTIPASGTATITIIAGANVPAPGPNGNTSAGVAMTFPTPPAGLTAAAVVAAGGIVGGEYLVDSDAVYYQRGFNVLKNPTLNLSGSTSAADVTNNPTIFKQPVR